MRKLFNITIFTLFIVMCMGLVSAADTLTLNTPSNETYQVSTSMTPNFTMAGNASTYTCKLWGSENGSAGEGTWREIETDSGVSNNTPTSFATRSGIAEISKGDNADGYIWNVICNSSSITAATWATNNYSYWVDTTSPAVTVTPADLSWDADGYVVFGVTTVDENPESCYIYSNLNATTNGTGSYAVKETDSYTNATTFYYDFGNASQKWLDNNTDAYKWNVSCNDSAGNTNSMALKTIRVDSTAPSAFGIVALPCNLSGTLTMDSVMANNTLCTDLTPTIEWNTTTELNFSRYWVQYYSDAYSTLAYNENITSMSTLTSTLSTISASAWNWIKVTAYDLAGNSVDISNTGYRYKGAEPCNSLTSGWNLCANPGNTMSLSAILNLSGATSVSFYNESHKFQTHTSGGSNGGVNVEPGDVMFINLGSADTFEGLIWNQTALTKFETFNLTNKSNEGWNLMGIIGSDGYDSNWTMNDVNSYFNGAIPSSQINCTEFSFYDNSASTNYKYIDGIGNWTWKNDTTMDFGNALWVGYSGVNSGSSNWYINRSAISTGGS